MPQMTLEGRAELVRRLETFASADHPMDWHTIERARELTRSAADLIEQDGKVASPPGGIGLETTEDVAYLREAWRTSDSLTGRFIRDHDRLSAEIARLTALLDRAGATTVEIANAREAAAREEERRDLVECIRSTTWSGTEEIVAMIRQRSQS